MGVMEGMKELLNYFVSSKEEILSLLIEHIELTVLGASACHPDRSASGHSDFLHPPGQQAGAGFRQHCSGSAKHGAVRSAIPVFGIGMKPAIFLVVIYSLLPIIKNTYAGLMNINEQMLEAAERNRTDEKPDFI